MNTIVTQDRNVFKWFVAMDKDINHLFINMIPKRPRFLSQLQIKINLFVIADLTIKVQKYFVEIYMEVLK